MASTAVLELASKLRRIKRAAERARARVRFALRGKRRAPILSEEQMERFRRDGFLLVSRLIPDEVSAAAESAMWDCAGASRDSRESWARLGPRPRMLDDPRLVACFTDECMLAASQLAGEDIATFLPPKAAYTVNVLPQEGEWRWHLPHIDHANPAARHRTIPRAFRIATMAYLNDVEVQEGGTAVWPGSHLRMEALARSDRRRYRYMSELNLAVHALDLGAPTVLTPRRGDVLMYHYLLIHSGTTNLGEHPRLAVRKVW